MFEYLIWLFIFVAMPILVLYFSFRNILKVYKKFFICIAILSVIFATFWGIVAVWSGVWYFPSEKNLEIIVFNLPLEEFLFMISVSVWISMLTVVVKCRK